MKRLTEKQVLRLFNDKNVTKASYAPGISDENMENIGFNHKFCVLLFRTESDKLILQVSERSILNK